MGRYTTLALLVLCLTGSLTFISDAVSETLFLYQEDDFSAELRYLDSQYHLEVNSERRLSYEIFTLTSPNRVVLDLLGLGVENPGTIRINDEAFKALRTGRHSDRARLVLDLKLSSLPEYLVEQSSGKLIVSFDLNPTGVKSKENSNLSGQNQKLKIVSTPTPTPTPTGKAAPVSLSDRSLIFYPEDRTVKNFTVRNLSLDQSLLITVAQEGTESLVIISPKSLVLAPGEEKTLRVLLQAERNHNEQQTELSLSVSKVDKVIEGKPAEKHFIDIDISVLVMPSKSSSTLEWKRKDDLIVITNRGNVTVTLEEGKLCLSASQPCSEILSRKIAPEASAEILAPLGSRIEFMKSYAGEYEVFVIQEQISKD